MTPTYPRLLPDRDKLRKWYVLEGFEHELHNGDKIYPHKGYRFDGHSLNPAIVFLSLVAAFCVWNWWLIPANLCWSLILLCAYLKYRYVQPKDILASLIHDYLIDLEHSHRYNRAFMDKEYEILMNQYSSGIRKWVMPKAVWLAGYLKFTLLGDYRGEPKPNTRIEVKVTHDTV